VRANWQRLGFVARIFVKWALWPSWNLLWLLGPGMAVLVYLRGLRPIDVLAGAAFMYMLVMSLTYMFSAFVPFQVHVLASLSRLMAHVAPLLAIWLLLRALELWPVRAGGTGHVLALRSGSRGG
jgi:hypothetical protein